MKFDFNVNKEFRKMIETLEKCKDIKKIIWGMVTILGVAVIMKYLPALILALK